MIVVDTNIIGYLYLTGEYSERVERILEKDADWIAPLLWRSEMRNVLAMYLRKNILTLEEAQQIMEEAQSLMQGQEYDVASWQVLSLARQSRCSAYDCEFVVLAREMGVPLVTMDRAILEAFPDVALGMDAYLKWK